MDLSKLYIVGGQHKNDAHRKKEWHRSKKGIVVQVNPMTETSEACLEYISPADARPTEDPSILFKAGTVMSDRFYLCTTTEVLIYQLPHFEKIAYISLPRFHDLHHVQPTPRNTLLIPITGLDMVVEISMQGEVIREWNVLGEDPWDRFSRDVDYRRVLTTKPHQSHPNYVFQIDNDIWVTRFRQRDAICLTNPERRIAIDIEKVHDGVLYDGLIYFTTVDGHIVIANPKTTQLERVINLNEINRTPKALGWCRGLHIIDRDHVIVGFSRLRPTKIKENLLWLRSYLMPDEDAGKLPTRIALYNLKKSELCWEYNLEDVEENVSEIFSIHAVTL
jgi:hypothetical protein